MQALPTPVAPGMRAPICGDEAASRSRRSTKGDAMARCYTLLALILLAACTADGTPANLGAGAGGNGGSAPGTGGSAPAPAANPWLSYEDKPRSPILPVVFIDIGGYLN